MGRRVERAVVKLGYHASHEQFTPGDLLEWVQRAERAGFDGAMCSDHFMPWTEAQGESGFAWSWLGAALATTGFPIGSFAVPGQARYHPAILAQAMATLSSMFPERFWAAVGSGEALNEHVTGEPWPPERVREARLRESVDVMRRLFTGEEVTHDGRIRVETARLYTHPSSAPPLYGGALSEGTAEWCGGWADGLITVAMPRDKMRRIVEAFRRGGGEGKPLLLQCQVSWAENDEEALRNAHDQWRMAALPSNLLADLQTPAQFEAAAKLVRPEDLHGVVRISSDPDDHVEWLLGDAEMGFSRIYLHNVGRNQTEFIDAFGRDVLPGVREQVPARVSR